MVDWYKVKARHGDADLWVLRRSQQEPQVAGTPWRLEDGTSVYDLIIEDRFAEIPFDFWFEPDSGHRGTRRGDMLWTTGTTKIASTAMVEVLRQVGATGWSTFPVDLRDRDGAPIEGYTGLSVHSNDAQDDLNQIFEDHNFTFLARPHVIEALRAAGADAVDIEAFDPADYDDV